MLGGMAVVLLSLAPVYLENFRLQQYFRTVAGEADAGDEALRSQVVARARDQGLPLTPGEVRIARAGGKLRLEARYAVEMDFPLYQVDLHFHPAAGK